MSFHQSNLVLASITRLFLLVVIFGVLWVKEYLWWAFGLAIVLYVVSAIMTTLSLASVSAEDNGEEDDADPNDETDFTPPKPYRARRD
jgi:hypothetical protein